MEFKENDKVLVSCGGIFDGSEGIIVGMEEDEDGVIYFVELYETNYIIPLSEVENLYIQFNGNELKLIRRG